MFVVWLVLVLAFMLASLVPVGLVARSPWAAGCRPDRNPDAVYLMSDAGWLQFVGGATILLAMPLAIAAAAFIDHRKDPTFPRWAGYLNLWVVILIIPDQLLFFFHDGPLSWNGLFGLWLPVTAFGIWFISTFFLIRRALSRELVREPQH